MVLRGMRAPAAAVHHRAGATIVHSAAGRRFRCSAQQPDVMAWPPIIGQSAMAPGADALYATSFWTADSRAATFLSPRDERASLQLGLDSFHAASRCCMRALHASTFFERAAAISRQCFAQASASKAGGSCDDAMLAAQTMDRLSNAMNGYSAFPTSAGRLSAGNDSSLMRLNQVRWRCREYPCPWTSPFPEACASRRSTRDTGSARQPALAGGEGTAPSPFDLFLASIGTCAGYYALRFLQQRNLDTVGLVVTMTADTGGVGQHVGRIRIDVTLPPAFPQKYRRRPVTGDRSMQGQAPPRRAARGRGRRPAACSGFRAALFRLRRAPARGGPVDATAPAFASHCATVFFGAMRR